MGLARVRAAIPERWEEDVSGMVERIVSPCIGVCVLDPVTGFCQGCLRTADEIMAWPSADGATQRVILDELKVRRRSAGRVSARDLRPRRRRGRDKT